jgi:hypothetical protein
LVNAFCQIRGFLRKSTKQPQFRHKKNQYQWNMQSQTRTWISNGTCLRRFCVQWFDVRSDIDGMVATHYSNSLFMINKWWDCNNLLLSSNHLHDLCLFVVFYLKLQKKIILYYHIMTVVNWYNYIFIKLNKNFKKNYAFNTGHKWTFQIIAVSSFIYHEKRVWVVGGNHSINITSHVKPLNTKTTKT